MKLTCVTIYYTILQHVLQDVPRLLEHSNEHVRTVNCNMLVFFKQNVIAQVVTKPREASVSSLWHLWARRKGRFTRVTSWQLGKSAGWKMVSVLMRFD